MNVYGCVWLPGSRVSSQCVHRVSVTIALSSDAAKYTFQDSAVRCRKFLSAGLELWVQTCAVALRRGCVTHTPSLRTNTDKHNKVLRVSE